MGRYLKKISPRQGHRCQLCNNELIIWVEIAKTGVTSRKAAVGKCFLMKGKLKNKEFFSIAFVRHPMDRFVSAYRNKYHNWKIGPLLDELLKIDPRILDNHLKPQSCFPLVDKVDFQGRFETFQQDWDTLRKKLPHLLPLPHLNRSKPRQWQELLNGRNLKKAEKLYRKDFELLGYE